MKLHPHFVPAILLLALAACRPGAAEFSESEAPKQLKLDNISSSIDLRFVPGSSRLVSADAARLRALAASGSIAPSDRVTVLTDGAAALSAARFATIATELLRYRIVASEHKIARVSANHAVVESGRYLVSMPRCPNWSGPSAIDFTNTNMSNFGCATALNLGQMVAYPADLVEGRPIMSVEGQPAAAAVNRYLNDKVQLPAAADVGPIAASSSAAPPVAAGATGSQP